MKNVVHLYNQNLEPSSMAKKVGQRVHCNRMGWLGYTHLELGGRTDAAHKLDVRIFSYKFIFLDPISKKFIFLDPYRESLD